MVVVLRVALRVVVLVCLYVAYMSALPVIWGTGNTDANIGAGLVAFLGLVVVSAVWGAVDGARQGWRVAVPTWLVVGLLSGLVAQGIPMLIFPRQWEPVEWVTLGLFLAALVAVPGAVCAALGGPVTRGRTQGIDS